MERSREKIKRSKTHRKDESSTSSSQKASRRQGNDQENSSKYKDLNTDESVHVTEPLLNKDKKTGIWNEVWHQMKCNKMGACCQVAIRGKQLTTSIN